MNAPWYYLLNETATECYTSPEVLQQRLYDEQFARVPNTDWEITQSNLTLLCRSSQRKCSQWKWVKGNDLFGVSSYTISSSWDSHKRLGRKNKMNPSVFQPEKKIGIASFNLSGRQLIGKPERCVSGRAREIVNTLKLIRSSIVLSPFDKCMIYFLTWLHCNQPKFITFLLAIWHK